MKETQIYLDRQTGEIFAAQKLYLDRIQQKMNDIIKEETHGFLTVGELIDKINENLPDDKKIHRFPLDCGLESSGFDLSLWRNDSEPDGTVILKFDC